MRSILRKKIHEGLRNGIQNKAEDPKLWFI